MTETRLPIDQILQGHTQSLLKALRLFSEHDGQPAKVALNPITQTELLQSLQQSAHYLPDRLLLNGYINHHFGERLLSADIRSALPFVDLLISQLLIGSNPDQSIDESCRRLSLVLCARLLARPDIAINTQHPLCQFIHQLYNHLAVWEPAAGKTGRRFSDWLHNLVSVLPQLDINSSSTLNELIEQLDTHRQQDQTHQLKLEQRIKDSQDSHDQIDKARDNVVGFIVRRLSGQPLPEELVDFIQTHVIPDLQYLLIHQGIESPDWKRWQRLLQTLSWAFKQTDSDAHRNKVMTLLPPMIDQIDESYWQHFPKTHHYSEFIEALNEYFVLILQTIPVECAPFPSQEYAEHIQQSIVVDQSMLDDLARFQEGDWFNFVAESKDAPLIKGKLLSKLPQHDRLLFVRYNGRKLAEYSFSDFSLALASKIARPIKQNHLYARTLKNTLQQLDRRYQHHLKLEQRVAENVAMQQAAAKAKQEAQALRKQSPARTRNDIPDQDKTLIREQLSALHVGAWIEIKSPNKQLKLSVKLQASDKYIFTDRVGKKAADHSLAELVAMMAQGELSILSQGEHFENSLEKVVRGLRKNTQ
ncbi:MAG: hypothetical protein CL693_19750 [Cellvibrionaceae bacterium]|nr:hypothetical protein [Cellvibrionaceae bacterium]|tara:strand:+ start:207409 stop:209169 length:1761 start_codon:yes stop_codon:yes gene_type:complete